MRAMCMCCSNTHTARIHTNILSSLSLMFTQACHSRTFTQLSLSNSNRRKHHHRFFKTGVNTAWPQRFQSWGLTTSQIIAQSKIDRKWGRALSRRAGREDRRRFFCKLHCGETQVDGESFIFGCTCPLMANAGGHWQSTLPLHLAKELNVCKGMRPAFCHHTRRRSNQEFQSANQPEVKIRFPTCAAVSFF